MQYRILNHRTIIEYDRPKAVEYAHTWAFKRNRKYYDFSLIGGDCTNFCSQILYAGSGVMNYSKNSGWYYASVNNRSPSWTGVNFLFDFLVHNKVRGPFAREVAPPDILPGDLIQLSFSGGGTFQHSLAVVEIKQPLSFDNILISTHTIDRDYYPLSSYEWKDIRFLHILGVYI